MNAARPSSAVDQAGATCAGFRPILVWDASVRACLWLMMLCVAGGLLTEGQARWRAAHEAFGFTLGVLAALRIGWGFFGSRYARFDSFLAGPGAVLDDLRGHLHGWGRRHLGHGPAGGWLVLVLLLLALMVPLTGWLAAASMPSGASVLHRLVTQALAVLGAAYALGLAWQSWRSGENLLAALWTGRRIGHPTEAIDGPRRVPAACIGALAVAAWSLHWA